MLAREGIYQQRTQANNISRQVSLWKRFNAILQILFKYVAILDLTYNYSGSTGKSPAVHRSSFRIKDQESKNMFSSLNPFGIAIICYSSFVTLRKVQTELENLVHQSSTRFCPLLSKLSGSSRKDFWKIARRITVHRFTAEAVNANINYDQWIKNVCIWGCSKDSAHVFQPSSLYHSEMCSTITVIIITFWLCSHFT